jgi:hypothetical protein
VKKLLFLSFALTVFTTMSAQEYDYENPGDSGGDSYGSEDSYSNDNSGSGGGDDATSLLGEEPIQNYEEESPVDKKKPAEKPKNPNVPGEIHKWQLNLGTSFVGVTHIFDTGTATKIGLPLTSTHLSAGYQLTSQIWIMAKFHFYMDMFDDDAMAQFIIGPGVKAEFIRTDKISFFGGLYISVGCSGKTFIFSPEIFTGIDYNITPYFSVGLFTSFNYELFARDENKFHIEMIHGNVVVAAPNDWPLSVINFILGPQLTVYF